MSKDFSITFGNNTIIHIIEAGECTTHKFIRKSNLFHDPVPPNIHLALGLHREVGTYLPIHQP